MYQYADKRIVSDTLHKKIRCRFKESRFKATKERIEYKAGA